MEWLVLGLFCAGLLLCVVLRVSLLYALLAGLLLFCLYAKGQGHGVRQIGGMLLDGLRTARGILIVFALIGMLTALWRACGTIPMLLCWAADLIRPATFLLTTFLLNCAVSVLTGTAFGTAATMGVVCMAMGTSLGASPLLTGGAILSGAYFGDRCSPVSTSALLVAELTGTDIYGNIRRMLRAALLPFLLTCAVYAAAGLLPAAGGAAVDLRQLFGRALTLRWYALLPAAALLVLSALRVDVKLSLSVSIAAAAVLCLTLQHTGFTGLLRLAVRGYSAPDPEIAALLDGGGLVSMLRVMAIVGISSSYTGIFRATGLLDRAKTPFAALSRRATPFGGILAASVLTAMIACNQTLTILLTHQLCGGAEPEKEQLAADLENSAVVVAPLVPWSIANAVPLSTVGAPTASLLAACFLYLLPLCTLLGRLLRRRR